MWEKKVNSLIEKKKNTRSRGFIEWYDIGDVLLLLKSTCIYFWCVLLVWRFSIPNHTVSLSHSTLVRAAFSFLCYHLKYRGWHQACLAHSLILFKILCDCSYFSYHFLLLFCLRLWQSTFFRYLLCVAAPILWNHIKNLIFFSSLYFNDI